MTTDTTDRQLGWVLLALVAALFVLPAFAMGFGMMGTGPMMGGYGDHGTWGMDDRVPDWMVVVGVVFQLLFLAVLVGAGYLGFRRLTSASESTDPAIQELRTAYARGELSDDEFDRRRTQLERTG